MNLLAWRRSLEGHLVLRLTVLVVAASAIGLAALLFGSYHAASELSDEALADRFVGEFLRDAAWAYPLVAIGLILVVIWTVRAGLRPVREAAVKASAITPGMPGVRLPTEGLPSELTPLMASVNLALDRLEHGFEVQKRFTANAAHELRTPLTILTAALEAQPDTTEMRAMRRDAGRMNRLVEQLLKVARLDSAPQAPGQRLDLRMVAEQVVESLAPWAVSRGRSIGFEAPSQPVWIVGDPDLLGDAVRNLAENAVAHTPPGTEVEVSVSADAVVRVRDHGTGVPAGDRARIFERFVRLSTADPGQGAGLGLAIVSETAKAHGGDVRAETARDGGAVFILDLGGRLSASEPPACESARPL